MQRKGTVGLLGLVAVVALGLAVRAEEMPGVKVKIGERLPDFQLKDVQGRNHTLHENKGRKAIAVIFIATKCPYSNAFNGIMARLAEEYGPKGVAFVGINANKTEPVREVAEHARSNNFSFTVLKDEGNVYADRLGATVTPEVFLLDTKFLLRYHGAIGNSAKPTTKVAEATDQELRPALDAMLAGQPVAVANTKAFGCTIKRLTAEEKSKRAAM